MKYQTIHLMIIRQLYITAIQLITSRKTLLKTIKRRLITLAQYMKFQIIHSEKILKELKTVTETTT